MGVGMQGSDAAFGEGVWLRLVRRRWVADWGAVGEIGGGRSRRRRVRSQANAAFDGCIG